MSPPRPPNSLQVYLAESDRWTEVDAMDTLSDYALVPGNAIWARHVPEEQCPRAIEFLRRLAEREPDL